MVNKRQRLALQRQQDEEERALLERYQADLSRPWRCGVWDNVNKQPAIVYASADTEQEAEAYMMLRHRRNDGVMPHRLTQTVGWWHISEEKV